MYGRVTFPLSLTALALLLAGCAVGPDYRAPEPVTPGAFGETARQNAPDVASKARSTAPTRAGGARLTRRSSTA